MSFSSIFRTKSDIVDITSPVIFRLGGDEIGVIAPYIPPPEKVKGVVKAMKEIGVDIKYKQLKYPQDFKTTQDVLNAIMEISKIPGSRLNFI